MVFLKKKNKIYFSPPGGIGRRTGLKILRIAKSVPVQVRGRAPHFMIDSVNFFGLLGGFLTTIAFVPQVIKSWRAKSVKDLSFLWLIIFNSGVTFWLIYGFLKSDIAIILANSMTLILASSLLFMKIKEYYS